MAFITPMAADATEVRVRSRSRLNARVEALASGDAVAGESARLVVSGSLSDDAGDPIPSGRVSISCHPTSDAAGETNAAVLFRDPEPCHGHPAATDGAKPGTAYEQMVDTDDAGAFCLLATLPISRATLRLRFHGDRFHDPASVDAPTDQARPAVAVAFDPALRIVSLDREALQVGVRLYRPQGEPETGTELAAVRLRLTDERGRLLGVAATGTDGRARFDVSTRSLREPGPGELRVETEGAEAALKVSVTQPIERHATVAIEAVGPSMPAMTEDTAEVRLRARWARGVVAGGAVEAVIEDQNVGGAAVRDGVAVITLTLDPSRTAGFADSETPRADRFVRATLRYLPDAPWWEPGEAASVAVPVPSAPRWRRALLALVAFAVAAWMLRGSWQPRWRRIAPMRTALDATADRGTVRTTRAGTRSDGYRGQVLDAHDGTPLAGATVSIVGGAFPAPPRPPHGDSATNALSNEENETDEHGRFSILSARFGAGARLKIRSPWHTTLETPLPSPGELTVHMISRRRHLLSRLVDWARRERATTGEVQEPTPRQVSRGSGGDVIAWAAAVEAAAFGELPVDERREKVVLMLEPRSGHSSASR
jgi:hypothetical protein